VERRLDALKGAAVTKIYKGQGLLQKTKKRPSLRPPFVKEAWRKGNLSGKAMHDAVPTYAETHGLKKSQFLEEG